MAPTMAPTQIPTEKTLEDMKAYLIAHDKTPDNPHFLFHATLLYLGHLICRAQFAQVLAFLDNLIVEELEKYLNAQLYEFWDGTLLHILLQWNKGRDTFEMYKSLRLRGANPCKDNYGNFPWEDQSTLLIAPTDHTTYGERDVNAWKRVYDAVTRYENIL
jgi:hypothetical protein